VELSQECRGASTLRRSSVALRRDVKKYAAGHVWTARAHPRGFASNSILSSAPMGHLDQCQDRITPFEIVSRGRFPTFGFLKPRTIFWFSSSGGRRRLCRS